MTFSISQRATSSTQYKLSFGSTVDLPIKQLSGIKYTGKVTGHSDPVAVGAVGTRAESYRQITSGGYESSATLTIEVYASASTSSASAKLYQWFHSCLPTSSGGLGTWNQSRANGNIQLLDPDGKVLLYTWYFQNAWPKSYSLATMDVGGSDLLVETYEIVCERLDREDTQSQTATELSGLQAAGVGTVPVVANSTIEYLTAARFYLTISQQLGTTDTMLIKEVNGFKVTIKTTEGTDAIGTRKFSNVFTETQATVVGAQNDNITVKVFAMPENGLLHDWYVASHPKSAGGMGSTGSTKSISGIQADGLKGFTTKTYTVTLNAVDQAGTGYLCWHITNAMPASYTPGTFSVTESGLFTEEVEIAHTGINRYIGAVSPDAS